MSQEQIINLWNLGYSKKYMYEMEYQKIKKDKAYKNLSSFKKKEIAKLKIDLTLLKVFYKDKEFKPISYYANMV